MIGLMCIVVCIYILLTCISAWLIFPIVIGTSNNQCVSPPLYKNNDTVEAPSQALSNTYRKPIISSNNNQIQPQTEGGSTHQLILEVESKTNRRKTSNRRNLGGGGRMDPVWKQSPITLPPLSEYKSRVQIQ